MGNMESSMINADDVNDKVRTIRSSLTERDRRLYNFAKFKILETPDLEDVEIVIDFEDRDEVRVNASTANSRIFFGFDYNMEPRMSWQNVSFMQTCRQYFVGTWEYLKCALRSGDQAAIGYKERTAVGYS